MASRKKHNNLSKILRSVRVELGYSQSYVASRLKITQQAYSKIENEPVKCSLITLLEISEILMIDPAQLISPFTDDTYIEASFEKNIEVGIQKILNELKEFKELKKNK